MNIEELREYCIQKAGVTEEFPFDESTLVFKVMGKMFALTGLNNPELSINLKCEPEYAIELRASYSSIIPGYHMNKKHWNTLQLSHGEIPTSLVKELIDLSYNLVVAKLTKALKEQLKDLQ